MMSKKGEAMNRILGRKTQVKVALAITLLFLSTVNSWGLAIGDRVAVVNGPWSVRATAGTSGTYLGQQYTGATGTIAGGPTDATGYTWYNVNFASSPSGWIAVNGLALNSGSLYVLIFSEPIGAVSAGAQWQVDGGPWQNTGIELNGLSVGNHPLRFKSVAGWNTPTDQTVTVAIGQTATAYCTYTQAAQGGSLTITISPSGAVSAGAQWQVDGGVLQNSGATVSGLTVGNHTVHCTSVSGWAAPSDFSVTIANGQYTSQGATYTQASQSGSLTVTISPAGAVSAGAQWQVDSSAWQSSGATYPGLSVGSHTVHFKAISGWTAPSDISAAITSGGTTSKSGTYVQLPQGGYLTVSISPSGVVSAGAQWQVDGGSWQSGGATVSNLTAGAHTVHFAPVSGWAAPSDISVTIANGQYTSTGGTYTQVTQSGSLTVSIGPAGAVSAGAQWQVDGGSWQNSGATVSGLSVSTHTIHFKTVSGWTTPSDISAAVSSGGLTSKSGTYTATSTVTPTVTTLPATQVTATSAQLNGTINPNGRPTTITFVYVGG